MQFFKIFEIKFNPSIYFLFREYFFHIKLTKPFFIENCIISIQVTYNINRMKYQTQFSYNSLILLSHHI